MKYVSKIDFIHPSLGLENRYKRGGVYEIADNPIIADLIKVGYLQVYVEPIVQDNVQDDTDVSTLDAIIELKEAKVDKRTKEYKAKRETK